MNKRYLARLVKRLPKPHFVDLALVNELYESQRGLCTLSTFPLSDCDDQYAAVIDKVDPAGEFARGNVQLLARVTANFKSSHLTNSQVRRVLMLLTDRKDHRLNPFKEMPSRNPGPMWIMLEQIWEWAVDEFWLLPLSVRLHHNLAFSTLSASPNGAVLVQDRGGDDLMIEEFFYGESDNYRIGESYTFNLADPDCFEKLTKRLSGVVSAFAVKAMVSE
jgi:hypothetical protein